MYPLEKGKACHRPLGQFVGYTVVVMLTFNVFNTFHALTAFPRDVARKLGGNSTKYQNRIYP